MVPILVEVPSHVVNKQHTYENENAMNVGANNHCVLLGFPFNLDFITQFQIPDQLIIPTPTKGLYSTNICIYILLTFNLQTWWIHQPTKKMAKFLNMHTCFVTLKLTWFVPI